MTQVTLGELLDAGVHFGHQSSRWNPKMFPYIYTEQNGIHVIDLVQTARLLTHASNYVQKAAKEGKSFLFIGTKRQASEIIAEQAKRCNSHYVNNRWLGGTLTNYRTIKTSVDRLIRMEYERDQGRLESRTKKERLDHARKIAKMDRSLGGIKTMKGMPGVLFVIDPKREHNAIKEARKLNIPVVALCDTNCDPTGIDYVIPGNDDAIKSISLFTGAIADAIIEGKSLARGKARDDAPESGARPESVEFIER